MRTIPVRLEEESYPIYLGAGALKELGARYREHDLGERAAVITDRTVEKLFGSRALAELRGAGVKAQLIPVPPGEASKSLRWTDRLYTRLIWAGFNRDATIVALGGGAVGDLAGFVAASYLRGVRWVQVPTTLLAQVDAAIGGKTGINHRLGKNLIGAFHQPRFVLTDPELLATLPERELRAGLAEVVKYGLIRDPELFARLEVALGRPDGLSDPGELIPLIERSCEIKSEIVSRDVREAGERALLNFGHTLGHAVEAAVGYRGLLHGEAVAWGMLGEAWISRERGWLPPGDFQRVEAVVRALEAPPPPSDLEIESLFAYIRRDKKVRRGRLHGVLLTALGRAELTEFDELEIREAMQFITLLER